MKTHSKIVLALVAATAFACASASKETKPEQQQAPQPTAQAQTPQAPAAPKYPETPDAAFRAQKPAALPGTPHFEAPVPVQRKLKNGLQVLIVENHQLPLVVAELTVKTGIDGNPLAQPGLAEFTASMLDEGTKKRSAMEIAEQLENLAANLSAAADEDSTRIHLNCLTETLPQALDIMADVSLHPAFTAKDIARVKKAYLTDLAQRRAIPAYIAIDTADRILYGEKNPWGQPKGGTEQAVSKLSGKDLTGFHSKFFVPQNALLTVSGDVQPDALVALLEKEFGSWKGKMPKEKPAPLPPEATQRVISAVDHPGSQSRVIVLHRMLTATSPDVVPLKTANYILGGLFSSRLNLNLREDKAYSYGVFSRLSFNDRTGVFTASGNMVATHTADAVSEMEKEFARFSDGKVTPDELSSAKSAYIRSLPSLLETNDAVASSMGTLALQGLPFDYYAKLPGQVSAVTEKDIARVAEAYIKPTSWPVVVVGPMAEQKAKLEALNLGPVQVLPPPGEPAAKAPVHGKPAAPIHEPSASAPKKGATTASSKPTPPKHMTIK